MQPQSPSASFTYYNCHGPSSLAASPPPATTAPCSAMEQEAHVMCPSHVPMLHATAACPILHAGTNICPMPQLNPGPHVLCFMLKPEPDLAPCALHCCCMFMPELELVLYILFSILEPPPPLLCSLSQSHSPGMKHLSVAAALVLAWGMWHTVGSGAGATLWPGLHLAGKQLHGQHLVWGRRFV